MSSNHPPSTNAQKSAQQGDLFEKPLFTSREAKPDIDFDRFRSVMKRAMSAAIRDCNMDRDAICKAVGAMSGIGSFSRSMLDNYTSESKQHDISLVRFKALVRHINAPQLWDLAVCDEGLLVLQGDEARLAEIARLQQEARSITAKLRKLRETPVHIQRQGLKGNPS